MLKGTNNIAWAKHKHFLTYISVRNLPNIKKQIEDKVVGWVDQPVMSFKLYLMNLCETGNAVLETVHSSPISFHHSPHLPYLSQKACNLSGNSYLDHLQFLKSEGKKKKERESEREKDF